jgi:hypothetical protein
MVAGQPFFGGIGKHFANHAAQRLLCQQIVADVIDGHGINRGSKRFEHKVVRPGRQF